MDVDCPCRSVVIVPPDRIEEDLPGQDSAGIAQEVFEQAKLFGGEQGLYFIDCDFVPCEIHDEIAIAVEGRAVVRFSLKPPEQSLDAGNQGLGAEWFDDVVVGSQFQADDGVRFFGFGGQHDDGEPRGFWSRSKACTNLDAVDLG